MLKIITSKEVLSASDLGNDLSGPPVNWRELTVSVTESRTRNPHSVRRTHKLG